MPHFTYTYKVDVTNFIFEIQIILVSQIPIFIFYRVSHLTLFFSYSAYFVNDMSDLTDN